MPAHPPQPHVPTPHPPPAPQPAAAGEERELAFVNGRGERLVGILRDTGSRGVVILGHGYIANQSWCQFPLLAAALAEAGVSSYRFDHAMAIASKWVLQLGPSGCWIRACAWAVLRSCG